VEATEKAAGAAPYQLATKNVTVHIHTADQAAAMEAVMGPAFDAAWAEATGEDGERVLELVNQIGQ
jgi:hypothetical protein